LKALFFVKDLAGDPQHVEKKAFDPARRLRGAGSGSNSRTVKSWWEHDRLPARTPGFFLVPADAESNVERCYVVAAATREISFL